MANYGVNVDFHVATYAQRQLARQAARKELLATARRGRCKHKRLRALERLGNQAYAHIHLGVWDLFGAVFKLICKAIPVVVGWCRGVLRLLDVLSRSVWPFIKSVTRVVFDLFTHRASLILFGSVATIGMAYLVCV